VQAVAAPFAAYLGNSKVGASRDILVLLIPRFPPVWEFTRPTRKTRGGVKREKICLRKSAISKY
jgi:hypothetical protein